jgi:hypothetical protein
LGVVKKMCGADQYGAPPMYGLKDGQAGAPATVAMAQGPAAPAAVPAWVPTAVAAANGPAGPAGALALAARKRRSARG